MLFSSYLHVQGQNEHVCVPEMSFFYQFIGFYVKSDFYINFLRENLGCILRTA